MKLPFIKLVLLFCVITALSLLTTIKAEAHAPDVSGTVVSADTNTPIAGVWVKWTNEWDQYRIVQTDANGDFYFPSLGNMTLTQVQDLEDTYVDAKNDGSNDTPLMADTDPIDQAASQFSCGDNPQSFTVIPQTGTNGTYSTISGVTLNNGNDTVKVGNIVFTPNGPPTYTISGNVFLDTNKDNLMDDSEINYENPFSISISPNSGTIITKSDGSYSINNLPAGTYTVSYLSLPNGYRITSPINGPPPSFSVTVGTGNCNTNGAPGASCN